jgi:hypothetical protein
MMLSETKYTSSILAIVCGQSWRLLVYANVCSLNVHRKIARQPVHQIYVSTVEEVYQLPDL